MPSHVLQLAERALVSRDSAALSALYSDSFVFEDTSAGLRIDTKEQLKAYFDRLFAQPGVKFSNVSFFSVGDRGAGQWTWQGRSTQSSIPFAVRGASLFKLGKDKIQEEIIFYDPRPAYA